MSPCVNVDIMRDRSGNQPRTRLVQRDPTCFGDERCSLRSSSLADVADVEPASDRRVACEGELGVCGEDVDSWLCFSGVVLVVVGEIDEDGFREVEFFSYGLFLGLCDAGLLGCGDLDYRELVACVPG